MNYDFIRFIGERLGSRVHPLWIYSFLAYQLVVSALVFLFDAGFSPLIVWIGWGLFLVVSGAYLLRGRQDEKKEETEYQGRERARMHRISWLSRRLEVDPMFRTDCRTCVHWLEAGGTCRSEIEPGDRRFRFHHDDERLYCLHWQAAGETGGEAVHRR